MQSGQTMLPLRRSASGVVSAQYPDGEGATSFTPDAGYSLSAGPYYDGAIVTLTKDQGGFGTKSPAKPNAFFSADLGGTAGDLSSDDSRAGAEWYESPVSTEPQGERSQEIVATGSNYSWMRDFGDGLETRMLSYIWIDNPGDLYVWVKTYDAFDHRTSYGLRTRLAQASLSGSWPTEGQLCTGQTSGATGYVESLYNEPPTHMAIKWDHTRGSVGYDADPEILFNGTFGTPETVTWDGGSATVSEYAGTYKSFNDKQIRWWKTQDGTYPSVAAGAAITSQLTGNSPPGPFSTEPQYLYTSQDGVTSRTGTSMPQWTSYANRWARSEWFYQLASAPGNSDGTYGWVLDGTTVFMNTSTFTHGSTLSHLKCELRQISNGAKLGTKQYVDSYYIDDSWKRLVISSSSTWAGVTDAEIQLPRTWSDTDISLKIRGGGALGSLVGKYLYWVDGSNVGTRAGVFG